MCNVNCCNFVVGEWRFSTGGGPVRARFPRRQRGHGGRRWTRTTHSHLKKLFLLAPDIDSWCAAAAALHIPLLHLSLFRRRTWTLETDSHRIYFYDWTCVVAFAWTIVLPHAWRLMLYYLVMFFELPCIIPIAHLRWHVVCCSYCIWAFMFMCLL